MTPAVTPSPDPILLMDRGSQRYGWGWVSFNPDTADFMPLLPSPFSHLPSPIFLLLPPFQLSKYTSLLFYPDSQYKSISHHRLTKPHQAQPLLNIEHQRWPFSYMLVFVLTHSPRQLEGWVTDLRCKHHCNLTFKLRCRTVSIDFIIAFLFNSRSSSSLHNLIINTVTTADNTPLFSHNT